MEFISSDTNVWIDFAIIDALELPFRLSYTYIMNKDAVEDELLSPPGLGAQLISYGLVPVELMSEEFFLAEEYGPRYKTLSVYDRIALAIAKNREITLLTGDGALRKAAGRENVPVVGTIGILDRLCDENRITLSEYEMCLRTLSVNNGSSVRLPQGEIQLRLSKLKAEKKQ